MTKKRTLGLLLGFALSLAPVQAQESPDWLELPTPLKKSLIMEPQLLSSGSRLHMIWSGTGPGIRYPEVFHASLSGKDTKWKKPRAPFFGKNKSRVRKVAVSRTRNLIGLLFQRSLRQSNDAYEVLLSISSDQGWSWSNAIEIDQFVAEKTGGTSLAVAGRQGSNRPEFAMAWSRDFGNVRAANFDFKSTVRPQGVVIGQHPSGQDELEVGVLGKEGFSVVHGTGLGLSQAHVKALVGKIDEGESLVRGDFGECFSVVSHPNGPSRLVYGSGRKVDSLTSSGRKWEKDANSAELPFSLRGVELEAAADSKKNLHLALLRPHQDKTELWYIGQIDKAWQRPTLVHRFDKKYEMRGFDIAVTKKFVYLVGSQGLRAKVFRKPLKK